jgi:hypothetical protein|nr:MAG TPA: hypothetical protein [Caudoviricetes sp.]
MVVKSKSHNKQLLGCVYLETKDSEQKTMIGEDRMTVETNSKDKAIEWLEASIRKLESFKAFVEDGSVIVSGGYFDDNYPVPMEEELTENNISLSIDFIEKK